MFIYEDLSIPWRRRRRPTVRRKNRRATRIFRQLMDIDVTPGREAAFIQAVARKGSSWKSTPTGAILRRRRPKLIVSPRAIAREERNSSVVKANTPRRRIDVIKERRAESERAAEAAERRRLKPKSFWNDALNKIDGMDLVVEPVFVGEPRSPISSGRGKKQIVSELMVE